MEENQKNGQYIEETDTISLLDIVKVLVKHWKFIFFSTVIAGALIVGYNLYCMRSEPGAPYNSLPTVYTPEVIVRVQGEGTGSTSGLLANQNLITIASGGSSSSANPQIQLAIKLLNGDTLIDQVVKEFNIIEKYNIKDQIKSKSRKAITGSLQTESDDQTETLTIGFTHTDKVFATNIVNRILELLEKRFKELTIEPIETKKEFLENQLRETEEKLSEAQDQLLDFQQKHGIVGASVSSSGMAADLIFAEYKTREERHRITREFLEIEIRRRNLEELYKLFMNQLESAKIEIMDNTKNFQIIEDAEIPEVKSGPSRGTISMIVTLLVFFLSVFLSFIMEYFEKVKQDPVEAKKLEEIKDNFRIRKKIKNR